VQKKLQKESDMTINDMREVMKELAVLSMDAPLVEGEDSGT
jgi:hypothetical protein